MKKRMLLAILLIFGLVVFLTPGRSSAQSQFLNNWTIDIDGLGGFDPVTINEFLDIVGPAYVVNSFTTALPSVGDSGTFDDFAVFVSSQHDFGQPFPWFWDNELTGIFHGSGTVELGGPLGFAAGGTLEIYADLGKAFAFATDTADSDSSIYGANEQTLIAAFEVESGDGTVDPTGVPNGQITVIFKATFLAPDVWVDGNGTDLSTKTSLVRGFSTTNASFVGNPTSAMITDLAGEFAGVSPSNTPPWDMFVGANGQFRLFVEEEDEPADCRVTAGGNKDGIPCDLKPNGTPDNNCAYDITHTWGGQAGASGIDGNWTHHYKESNKVSFLFHSNTVFCIECSDPGYCDPARPAPYHQIHFAGIGQFNNKKGFDENFPVGEDRCFEVHLEDISEPGPGGKWPSSDSPCEHCPGTSIVHYDPVTGQNDCEDCTDYYEIKIYKDAGYDEVECKCTGDVLWVNGSVVDPNCGTEDPKHTGFFTRAGNVQIHPAN